MLCEVLSFGKIFFGIYNLQRVERLNSNGNFLGKKKRKKKSKLKRNETNSELFLVSLVRKYKKEQLERKLAGTKKNRTFSYA